MADIDRLEHNGVPELLRKQVDIGSSRYAEVGAAVLTDSTGALITSSNPLPVSSSTNGITSVAKIDIAAGTTNATSVKASPGRVLGVECKVVRASDVFLKIFNVTGTPVPGTTAVRDQIRLPLSSNVNLTFGDGIYCSTGIGIALTTGVAESDTGALTAGDVTFFRIRYA